jgi:hypothetical protein
MYQIIVAVRDGENADTDVINFVSNGFMPFPILAINLR